MQPFYNANIFLSEKVIAHSTSVMYHQGYVANSKNMSVPQFLTICCELCSTLFFGCCVHAGFSLQNEKKQMQLVVRVSVVTCLIPGDKRKIRHLMCAVDFYLFQFSCSLNLCILFSYSVKVKIAFVHSFVTSSQTRSP